MLTGIRARLGAAFSVVAVLLGGCSATGATHSNVAGSTLTIYTRLNPANVVSADVYDAERLALSQAGGQVGQFKIDLRPLSNGKISDSARTAIKDGTTIAYLGELTPNSSADSLGITNGYGILQVSPTDTALELTQATPAVKDAPGHYYQNLSAYGRTFGRVVPAADKEAAVLVKVMVQQHVHRLYVTDDTSTYGKAIAYRVIADAGSNGITVGSVAPQPPNAAKIRASGADAVFDGADSNGLGSTAALFSEVAAADPRTKLFASSPMAVDDFAGALSPEAARNTFVTAPGVLAGPLNKAWQLFISDFAAAYHHQPDASAIFGYVAMGAVLQALRSAGANAGSRSDVVHAFFHLSNFPTALGPLSINSATGDAEGIGQYVVSKVRGGKIAPFESQSQQG